ncbi:hypothetical protein [Streptomyces sp. DSM 41534]
MRHALTRAITVTAVLALAAFGLTACSDQDDCDTDALGTVAFTAPQRPSGGHAGRGGSRGSGSKAKTSKHSAHHGAHIDTDNCDD